MPGSESFGISLWIAQAENVRRMLHPFSRVGTFRVRNSSNQDCQRPPEVERPYQMVHHMLQTAQPPIDQTRPIVARGPNSEESLR